MGQISPEYDIILRRFRGDVIPDLYDDDEYPGEDADGEHEEPLPETFETPSMTDEDSADQNNRKSWD